jgi:KDO2-lipid IV(A) lauroyltransferase
MAHAEVEPGRSWPGRLRDRIVQGLLHTLRGLASDTACRLGGSLGVLAWRLGVRRSLVNEYLTMTLGLRGPARAKVARQCYATMGATFVEVFTAGGVDGIERHTRLMAPTHVARLREQGGLIFLSPHIGNWEGAIIGGMEAFPRVFSYAKAQHDPLVDRMVNACRSIQGAEILHVGHGDERGNAVRALRALREGAGLALMADQKPGRDEGVLGWFLGQPVDLLRGPLFFSRKAKVPMAPTIALRARSGETRIYILRPFYLPADDAMAIQLIGDAMSAVVAACPGQYFWHHRRFKNVVEMPPVPADPTWRSGSAWLRVPR